MLVASDHSIVATLDRQTAIARVKQNQQAASGTSTLAPRPIVLCCFWRT